MRLAQRELDRQGNVCVALAHLQASRSAREAETILKEGLASKRGETGAPIKGAHRLNANKTIGRMMEGRKALAFNYQCLSWRDVRGLFRQHYLSDENTAAGYVSIFMRDCDSVDHEGVALSISTAWLITAAFSGRQY